MLDFTGTLHPPANSKLGFPSSNSPAVHYDLTAWEIGGSAAEKPFGERSSQVLRRI
jgi:hypothetical protein